MKEAQFSQTQESWEPPPELRGPMPRKLKWKGGGVANLVMIIVFFFVGFGIVSAIFKSADDDHRLKQEAKEADAVVTRKWNHSSRGTTYYNVAYEFPLSGQTVRGECVIPGRIWRTLSAGSHLSVKYVPSEPEVNRASAAYEQLLPYWVGIAACAIWIGMLALAVFPVRKERRLLKSGQPAPGVITSHQDGRRPKYGYVIKYEFQLPDGTTVKGRAQRDAKFFFRQTICVLYDPKHPRRNSIYPLKLTAVGQSTGLPPAPSVTFRG